MSTPDAVLAPPVDRVAGIPRTEVCDACQCRLSDERCWNVAIGALGATLTICPAIPDEDGHVTLRYHDKCYPKNLIEYINAGYGHRRKSEDLE